MTNVILHMFYVAYAMAKVCYKALAMTTPIPRFHPDSVADLLTACRVIQMSGEGLEGGQLVRKLGIFVGGVLRHDVGLAELPFTVEDSEVIFTALNHYVSTGLERDPATHIAAVALLEEQCNPGLAGERSARLRCANEYRKSLGDLAPGFIPDSASKATVVVDAGSSEHCVVGRTIRSLALAGDDAQTGRLSLPPGLQNRHINAA